MGSAERELCSAVHPAAASLLTRLCRAKIWTDHKYKYRYERREGAVCCMHNNGNAVSEIWEDSLALLSKIVTLPRLEWARVRNTALVFSLSSHNLTLRRNQVLAQGVSL